MMEMICLRSSSRTFVGILFGEFLREKFRKINFRTTYLMKYRNAMTSVIMSIYYNRIHFQSLVNKVIGGRLQLQKFGLLCIYS